MIVVKIWILSLIIAFSYAFIISVFLNNKYYPTNLKKCLIFISKMVPYYFFISSSYITTSLLYYITRNL